MKPTVSIVIPIHAKEHRLRLTLAAVSALTPDNCHEVILVADNATAAVKTLAQAFQPATLLETPRLGRAGARNAGARAAKGDLLVFLDDDVLVRPDFVSRHIAAQRACPGLVHGRLREMIGLIQVADPSMGGTNCPPISEAALRNGQWVPDKSTRLVASPLEQAAENKEIFSHAPWLASAGANISLLKASWAQVGGFNEAYGVNWGLEDIDFGFRLWQQGIRFSIANDALGLHMSHYTPSRWMEQAQNFSHFLAVSDGLPEALALPELLSPNGSVSAYQRRICQIRQEA